MVALQRQGDLRNKEVMQAGRVVTIHNFATLVENGFTILSYKRLLKASRGQR